MNLTMFLFVGSSYAGGQWAEGDEPLYYIVSPKDIVIARPRLVRSNLPVAFLLRTLNLCCIINIFCASYTCYLAKMGQLGYINPLEHVMIAVFMEDACSCHHNGI